MTWEIFKSILFNNSNLHAYYRLEDTADSKGSFTLTNVNTVTFASAKFGNGAEQGASNTTKLLKNESFGTFSLSAGLSIGGWVKINTAPATNTQHYLLDLIASNGTRAKQLRILYEDVAGTKRILARIFTDAHYDIAFNITLPTTSLTHIALVYNGSTLLKLYVNEAFVGSVAVTDTDFAGTTSSFFIGSTTSSTLHASALIDDVFVVKQALIGDQIKEIYAGRYIGEFWPQTSLQGIWHLNKNFNDASANGYNLIDTNTPTDTAGKFGGGGKDFEASSSEYASITGASSPNLEITSNMTMMCFYRPDVVNTVQTIMGKNTAANNLFRYIATTAGGTIRIIFSGLADGDMVSTHTLTGGVLHWIIAIYDDANDKLKIFIDGKKTEQAETGTMSDLSATAFAIGRGGAFDGEYGDGEIDEAAVFSRAWSDREVKLWESWQSGRLM